MWRDEENAMSKKTCSKTVTAAGLALASSLAMSGAVAADNPFGMTRLSDGYMVAGKEGKCGGMTGKEMKEAEGKCGGMKEGKKEAEEKGKEGKCGEGKCGGKK